MKKIVSALTLIGFLGILLVPLMTSAQTPPKECCVIKRAITFEGVSCSADSIAAPSATAASACGTGAYCTNSEQAWGMFCLMNTLYNITDWIFVILVGLAGIFVIIGAMNLLTSAGDPAKVTSGRNYIMYAAIGLVVGLLSKAVPALVRLISGL